MSKWILALLISANAMAAHHHIPLDLTFEESQKWYQSFAQELGNKSFTTTEVSMAIDAGETLGKWLKKINESRPKNPIRITSKSTRTGIPVYKPKKYGPKTIEVTYKEFATKMPKEMFKVFFQNAPITNTIPVAEDVFVTWAKKLSKHYQSAVRWTGMQKWLDYYTKRRFDDVRGYYHLKSIKDLDAKLANFNQQTTDLQNKLKTGLLGICLNTLRNERGCEVTFNRNLKGGSLVQFKNNYWEKSAKLWNSFFEITSPRSDVAWSHSNPYQMEVPFLDPNRSDIANWLKENVEDEFKRVELGWKLELNYVSHGKGVSYLQFKPNVTPHVSGGNLIVMDANTSLEEYEVKWTIRHEYGHILRLPDCYVEFYDPSEQLMINYQLDTKDLMCSRSGDMNDRIYEELKRVYFK